MDSREVPPFEDGSMDAGLWALSQVAMPGEKFSLAAIGHVCGCSHEWINLLQKRALKKLRRALRHKMNVFSEQEFTREKMLQSLDAEVIPEEHLKL